MPKRGGRRFGAGRPPGAKTKRPFGNVPSKPPELPEAPLEVIQAVTVEARRDWKRSNRELVHARAEAWLEELESKAREAGDLRFQFELARFRIAYASGLPSSEARQEPDPDEALRRKVEGMSLEELRARDRELDAELTALAAMDEPLPGQLALSAAQPGTVPTTGIIPRAVSAPPTAEGSGVGEAPAPPGMVLGETHYWDRGVLVAIERPEVRNPLARRLEGLPAIPALNDRGEVPIPADLSAWGSDRNDP